MGVVLIAHCSYELKISPHLTELMGNVKKEKSWNMCKLHKLIRDSILNFDCKFCIKVLFHCECVCNKFQVIWGGGVYYTDKLKLKLQNYANGYEICVRMVSMACTKRNYDMRFMYLWCICFSIFGINYETIRMYICTYDVKINSLTNIHHQHGISIYIYN